MSDNSFGPKLSVPRWPTNITGHGGYMRSETSPDDYGYRGNVEMSNGLGVTTMIGTGRSDMGELWTKANGALIREQKIGVAWNNPEYKLGKLDSKEERWALEQEMEMGRGIRKAANSTTMRTDGLDRDVMKPRIIEIGRQQKS